jgi:hypothetical protein
MNLEDWLEQHDDQITAVGDLGPTAARLSTDAISNILIEHAGTEYRVETDGEDIWLEAVEE